MAVGSPPKPNTRSVNVAAGPAVALTAELLLDRGPTLLSFGSEFGSGAGGVR